MYIFNVDRRTHRRWFDSKQYTRTKASLSLHIKSILINLTVVRFDAQIIVSIIFFKIDFQK